MRFIKHFWSYLVMVGLIFLLHKPMGILPPLGRLFSPFEGFLQNTTNKSTLSDQTLDLNGVKEEVKVIYDNNQVPHIFANNEDDTETKRER
jgi:penicillin amidase